MIRYRGILSGFVVILRAVVPFWFVVSHQPAAATTLTGEELLQRCTATAVAAQQLECEAYISGIADGITTMTISMRLLRPDSPTVPQIFCIDSVTPQELTRATVTFLKQNPKTRRFNAASQVILALQQAFPCSDQRGN